MAWQSSGSSNSALIANLVGNGLIKSGRVIKAMHCVRVSASSVGTYVHDLITNRFCPAQVDRAHYSPALPYMDSPQTIGYGATISAPHMHANAAESLLPFLKPGANVLDIGSGSGYLTHVFAELVKPGGQVVGVDHIQELVDLARTNMAKSQEGRSLLENGVVKFIKADGRLGYPIKAPFDCIHVGAAAAEHHQALVDQLKKPGRLFVPVGDSSSQHIYVIDVKEDGTLDRKKLYGVRYVPLTDAPKS